MEIRVTFGTEPLAFAVVRHYGDMSGLIAVYGTYDSKELADDAIKALYEFGLSDQFTVLPFHSLRWVGAVDD